MRRENGAVPTTRRVLNLHRHDPRPRSAAPRNRKLQSSDGVALVVGSRLAAIACVFCLITIVPGIARAETGDIGYHDQSFNGAGTAPSGSKPESKLWWNDGSWWASMWDTGSGSFHIFRLDLLTQTWRDTGVPIDGRSGTRADTLWDGTHLYVASHVFSEAPTSGYPSRLYRFSYNPLTQTYSLDPGFPVSINNYKTETLVLDKDSTGKVWATWTQGSQVYVNRTTTSDGNWGSPFVLPVSGAAKLSSDDISSVVAFGGDKIGVMWSNQKDSALYFAVHSDGQPDTTWQQSRTAIAGPNYADDHINLKSLQAAGGRVFAAVKTSLNDVPKPNPNMPLNMLLARDPVTGDWSSAVFGRIADDHTRPIVAIDESNRVLHMFATAPVTGGTIYEKTSRLDDISFSSGVGTPVIRDAATPNVNNVTSTKQNVNSKTGLVVAATNDSSTGSYWHAYESISAPSPAPVADFSASRTSGTAPLDVSFSDASSGSPTSWSWDFGDGSTASAQNPTHTYSSPGTYTVKLTATNASGSDAKTKTGYISVTAPAPVADFSASPTSGTAPLDVSFSDASSGSPTSWSWDFGDGSTASAQNPTHTYSSPGTYTVKLTATNASGSDTKTKTGYISVSATVPAPVADFSASPTSGTAPLDVAFTDNSTNNPSSWSWDFGDGSTSSAQNPTHTYSSPGTYTVKLTATNGSGSDTKNRTDYISVTVFVSPPAADFSASPTSGTAPLAVSFSDNSMNSPTNWSWDFGDGSTSSLQNPTHTYSSPGTYTVKLTATNLGGSDTKSRTDYISVTAPPPAPVADFSGSPTSGTAPLDVSFSDVSSGSPTSWSWDFGDGSTSTAQNPTHTYSSAGTYTVKLTATNPSGSDSKTQVGYISARDPVVAAAGDIACPPGSTVTAGACQQQATSDLLVGGGYDAVLPLGDNQYENGELANYQQVFDPTWGRVKSSMHPTPGNHEYQTPGASGYFSYFGSLAGPSGRGYYSFDLGSWHLVSLDSEIPMGVGSAQESWLRSDLAAHQNDCVLAFWHQPLYSSDSVYGPGIAAVRPLYDDLYYAGADLVLNGHAHDYERFAPQDPYRNLDRTNGLRQFVVGTGGAELRPVGTRLPNSEVFSASSFGVLKLALRRGSYDWQFVPAAGGTLQDSGSGSCTNGAPPPPPPPVADFSATPTSGTAPLTASFTDASTNRPSTWSWDFGDGTSSTAQNPTHKYTSPGTYAVKLTAANAGGLDTKTRVGYVAVGSQPPVADFSATPTSGPAPLAVKFSDDSTNNPTSWSWDFGDGGTSTAQDPSHTYAGAGTYTVKLTATNAGGSDTKTRVGYITVSAPVSSYPTEVLADSPTSYWRLGEATGTTASDAAGANTGAVKGGVTLGAPGGLTADTNAAMTFDGTTGYVSVANSTNLNPTGDLTVEAWAKPGTLDSNTRAVVHKGGTSGYASYQYRLGLASSNLWRGSVYIGSNNYTVTSPSVATSAGWTYLAMTRSGSTLTLYVNGVAVSTSTASGLLNTSTGILAIGRTGSASVDYFKGSIDEVAVYPNALSSGRIAAHYRAGTGG
jgi:PKD repeat protein